MVAELTSVTSDWFGCVFVISFDGSGRLVSSPFRQCIVFFHKVQVMQWTKFVDVHVKRSAILIDCLSAGILSALLMERNWRLTEVALK